MEVSLEAETKSFLLLVKPGVAEVSVRSSTGSEASVRVRRDAAEVFFADSDAHKCSFRLAEGSGIIAVQMDTKHIHTFSYEMVPTVLQHKP